MSAITSVRDAADRIGDRRHRQRQRSVRSVALLLLLLLVLRCCEWRQRRQLERRGPSDEEVHGDSSGVLQCAGNAGQRVWPEEFLGFLFFSNPTGEEGESKSGQTERLLCILKDIGKASSVATLILIELQKMTSSASRYQFGGFKVAQFGSSKLCTFVDAVFMSLSLLYLPVRSRNCDGFVRSETVASPSVSVSV